MAENWEQRTNEVKAVISFILEGHTEEETIPRCPHNAIR